MLGRLVPVPPREVWPDETRDTPPLRDRSARLNMRITPDALDAIREAASAQQQDVTSFVGASMEHARAVLVEERLLRLTDAEVEQVDQALDAEPRVIPELARLIREVKGQRVTPTEHVTTSR